MDAMPKITKEESLSRLPDDQVLMRCRDVAYALGVSPGDLFVMRRAGTGPAWIRVGSCVMYRTNDIETYVLEQFAELEELQRERRRRQNIRASA